jgi:four helix bundle protein
MKYNNNQKSNNQVPKNDQNKNKQNKFDLESRTLNFANQTLGFLNEIPNNITNIEIKKQLIRSSTSIGANYIEANEAISKKDFIYRLKISRKEAKETIYWLNILKERNKIYANILDELAHKAKEFIYIFTAIIKKCL